MLSKDELALQMDLIPRETTGETGKTVGSLNDSRKRRVEILRMFHGEPPESIMVAKKGRPAHDDLAAGTYAKTSNVKHTGTRLDDIFDVSGQSCRTGALSQFPQNIGKAVVLLYSDHGSTVVDPFAGHNSRMQLCIEEGRNYIGQDISESFMEHNQAVATRLLQTYPSAIIELITGDSRHMTMVADEVGDFTLTSPPYYNLEYYGDESEQLGKAPDYAHFLRDLALVAKENYRVLKRGAFCAWFVNDFRLDGVFHPYHSHVLQLLIEAGFDPWDIMVVDLGAAIRSSFLSQVVDYKILPKRHEYGIIVRKPE